MPDIFHKVAGAWKKTSALSVKVAGAWKNVPSAWVKVAGAWKLVYSAGGGAVNMGDIVRSLRSRGGASAYLARTFVAPTLQNTFTWSLWIKRGELSALKYFLGFGGTTGLSFNAADSLFLQLNGAAVITTAAKFRDPTAWLHVVYRQQPGVTELWANGALVGTSATTSTQFNTAAAHQLFAINNALHFHGYMARICHVDGQYLAPSDFAEANSEGTWVTKSQAACKAIVDGPGNNNFMLDFDTGAALANLGNDFSDNNNDWTVNAGFSITLGADYDWMLDTPSNNHATLNPLLVGTSALTKGNLTSGGTTVAPTILPASGTWYLERSGTPLTWTPPAAFPAAAGDYNFGQRPFTGVPSADTLCAENFPADAVTLSGSFTGNANANGPFVWLGGVPLAMTINGYNVTWGTEADKLAGGFKLRSAAATHNAAGTNNFTVTVAGEKFKYANAQVNP